VLCQITSQSYADPAAIEISHGDMDKATLWRTSYVRPAKLFTANQIIVSMKIGELGSEKFAEVIDAVASLF